MPFAADARLAADPGARLVLVVPERDAHPVTRALAGRCSSSRPRSSPSATAGAAGLTAVPSTAMDAARLDALEQEFHQVEARLADPDVIADQTAYTELTKRYRELEPIVAAAGAAAPPARRPRRPPGRWRRRPPATTATSPATRSPPPRPTSSGSTPSCSCCCCRRTPTTTAASSSRSAGAEGGEEANLFARDLFDMYEGFAARQGWKLEVLGASESDARRLRRGHLRAARRRRVDAG